MKTAQVVCDLKQVGLIKSNYDREKRSDHSDYFKNAPRISATETSATPLGVKTACYTTSAINYVQGDLRAKRTERVLAISKLHPSRLIYSDQQSVSRAASGKLHGSVEQQRTSASWQRSPAGIHQRGIHTTVVVSSTLYHGK